MNTIKLIFLLIAISILDGCKPPSTKINLSTTIKYDSYGCFASEESEIKFYSEGNKTLVCLETNGKEIKREYINEGQTAAAGAFYSELQELPTDSPRLSTTTETIIIKSAPVNFTKII